MPPKAKPSTKATPVQPKTSSHSKSRPKGTKKPLSDDDKLKRLFATLCAQLDGGHFANAVKTCNKILLIRPDDPDALQTKLFVLLQTEQYNEALTLVDSLSNGNGHNFTKAYALYKTNERGKASELLTAINAQSSNDGHRGAMHLEAQLSYRHKDYESAVEQYSQLQDTAEPDSEEYADITTNLEAAQKHVDFLNAGYLAALDTLPTALASSLDTTPPPQQAISASSALAAAAANASTSGPTAAPVEKKVRMKRVPKGVVPGVTPPPDPERWLKKSERSTFGQGRRRRGGGGGGGGGGATQGSSVAEAPTSSGGGGGGSGVKGGGGKGKKRK